MATSELLDTSSRQQAEYGACGHGTIETWEGFASTIDRVQDSSIPTLRQGLHDGGHWKIDSPQIGTKAKEGVGSFHKALVNVVERLVTQSDSTRSEVLTSDDGAMTALQLRMTSLSLINVHGTAPNLEPMHAIWNMIAQYPNETTAGETLANLMAVFKGADNLKHNGQSFPLSEDFLKLVVSTSSERLTREGTSPVRRWLAQSLYTGYHNRLHVQYPLMLTHGSHPEVDVAVNSLDIFVKHAQAGGSHRKVLAGKYAVAAATLLNGGNPSTSRDSLAVAPSYGRKDTSLLQKAADVGMKLVAIAKGSA